MVGGRERTPAGVKGGPSVTGAVLLLSCSSGPPVSLPSPPRRWWDEALDSLGEVLLGNAGGGTCRLVPGELEHR